MIKFVFLETFIHEVRINKKIWRGIQLGLRQDYLVGKAGIAYHWHDVSSETLLESVD